MVKRYQFLVVQIQVGLYMQVKRLKRLRLENALKRNTSGSLMTTDHTFNFAKLYIFY